ncbi:hypothetical protein [Deinococcus gobiensis]|uniref:Uncharacterized protein n=1 Tax=Deinococcus gobiensis (strain DSM 21396 / JCM 16679 / CGMCC 1.7299 / I-0) TaxID=745776 RepID=H8GX85_DEIGI|nr:hypothetical protein [Deinococcus gobiensis]AFD25814.1 hypothetical protein DGo_CA1887 [Deinococcus gobiensis I-0]
MTKKFSMADLTASLLGADHLNREGEMVGEPSRPTRRRPALDVGNPDAQPSARQQQRDVRAYAESWHQALKDWQRRTGGLVVTHERTSSGTGRQMTPVVGNWPSTPAAGLWYSEVHTPMGWVAESALAVRCNAEPYLGRLRNGQGLVSLIHANGRGWNGAEARAYAAVVLGMAADLGDKRAIDNLKLLIVRESGTISLELDNL